jgi:hypothetical protein
MQVKLVRSRRGWELLRGGRPYFIRGAGGGKRLELMASSGANSLRTWGTGDAIQRLDAAHARNLSVCMGIWLGQSHHGFDYHSPASVEKQQADVLAALAPIKSHPAVLLWGIGNEMEGVSPDSGRDPAVWLAVESLARAIKKLDPNHPTMTVIAGPGKDGFKVAQIKKYCPSIDIVGINCYGGMATLPADLKKGGWDRPYIVTEFGHAGQWEVPKTPWGSPHQPSSTEKARAYLGAYHHAVLAQPGWCLGAYCFSWNCADTGVPSWYNMLVPGTEEKLASVDAMTLLWTGKWPEKRVPDVLAFQCSAGLKQVAPGSAQSVQLVALSPVPEARLSYEFVVLPDREVKEAERGTRMLTLSRPDGSLFFSAPTAPGGYLLYGLVRDGLGGAAYASLPFFVG